MDNLFQVVPTGVGTKGSVNLAQPQFEEVMKLGVRRCAENGYGWEDNASHVEEGGFIKGRIYVKSATMAGLAEEAGFGYKDASKVVRHHPHGRDFNQGDGSQAHGQRQRMSVNARRSLFNVGVIACTRFF